MLVLLTLLTAGYAAVVVRVLRARRPATSRPAMAGVVLPPDDRPPPSAHGWPPVDEELFAVYVADGFAALDAYLSEGHAA